MSFTEAIQRCVNRYAEFGGRATRAEFWWWTLFCIVATLALAIIDERFSLAFSVATLLPSFAVGSRRLHDVGRSGWWQLVGFIPVLGWLLMIVWLAQPSKPNGNPRTDARGGGA